MFSVVFLCVAIEFFLSRAKRATERTQSRGGDIGLRSCVWLLWSLGRERSERPSDHKTAVGILDCVAVSGQSVGRELSLVRWT